MSGLLTRTATGRAHFAPTKAVATNARLRIGLGLAGVVLVTALAATSRAPLVYDEGPYLKPVALLQQHGLSLRFLHDYPEPAGLLHNVLHWALAPITGLRPPVVRLVNPILLALTIAVSFQTLRLLGSRDPLATSLSLMAIPAIWAMTGMVLTEMPSILLTSLAVYLLLLAQRGPLRGDASRTAVALGGGALLGLAFLSRASVLIVLGAVPCVAVADWRRAAAFALGTCLVAGPIILYWGGLVPPGSVVPVAASSVSSYNLVLSFCYGATMMLIVAPRWFALPLRWALPVAGATVAVNLLTGWVQINALRSVVARLPGAFSQLAPRAAGSIMLALAVLFVVCSLKHAYERRHDRAWLFLCVAMLLLVASPAKITHQFSSRYTAMASGMMVAASDPFVVRSAWSVVGPLVGMLIGLSSLLSYYATAH